VIVAYGRGPPVAIFAGSWLCSRSPIDGSPIALGEPIGDCEELDKLARLTSIATAVFILKSRGLRVFYDSKDDEERTAAYAGGADGVLGEIKYRSGLPATPDDAAFVVVEAYGAQEVRRAVRLAGEIYRRKIEVLLKADFQKALDLGQYASGVVLVGPPDLASFEPASALPEIGRCVHCGVDFLMYGSKISRCLYCGRSLKGVTTQRRPALRPEVVRAIHKKFIAGALPTKIVIV
ncbi:MAG: hypothetical protein ABWJ97_04925, partial [Thermoproteus sp.]